MKKDIEASFAAAVTAMSRGPVGSELQAEYPEELRAATCTTFWGDPLRIALPEIVACELDRYGLIEPGVTRLFMDMVRPGSVVLDIGAHLGYFTLLASSLGASVHAFEPSHSTRRLLESNVAGRATVVPRGMWHERTHLELKDFGSRHSAVNTFLTAKEDSLGEPERVHAVEVTTVDDYSERVGQVPHLIKIDAEGAEAAVLEGARQTIAQHHPVITVEVGDVDDAPTSRRLLELAAALGYKPYDLAPDGQRPHPVKQTYGYGNIALFPRS